MFDFTKNYDDGFSPLPEDWYPVKVGHVEWKASQAGAEYLKVTLEVSGPKYSGRKIFHNINVMHPKEEVRNIAMAELKRMFVASGVDVATLANVTKNQLPALVYQVRAAAKIVIQENGSYGPQNVVKGWKPTTVDNTPVITTNEIPF